MEEQEGKNERERERGIRAVGVNDEGRTGESPAFLRLMRIKNILRQIK